MFDFGLFYERLKNPYVIAGLCLLLAAALLAIFAKNISHKFFANNKKTVQIILKFISIVIILIALILVIIGV